MTITQSFRIAGAAPVGPGQKFDTSGLGAWSSPPRDDAVKAHLIRGRIGEPRDA
ncbi:MULTISPECIES: hypothetical protein [unclassified Methylobacterium]|uniref:hypothetical protein n=1 Tax=unclassified Methylobacterium TaxID=2615210 RepID=UPI00226A83CD|nr:MULTISPECIES: hypothetical protein [unclassified Methylobacterium]